MQARVDHPDPAVANAEALHELENGATGLTLVFAGSVGAYGYGLRAIRPDTVARVLEGVHLDAIGHRAATAEPDTRDIADHVAALVKSRGIDAPARSTSASAIDALGAHSADRHATDPR